MMRAALAHCPAHLLTEPARCRYGFPDGRLQAVDR